MYTFYSYVTLTIYALSASKIHNYQVFFGNAQVARSLSRFIKIAFSQYGPSHFRFLNVSFLV